MKKIWTVLVCAFMVLATFLVAHAETDDTIAEGYTESGEGYTSVVTWIKNGELNIFGKFYYPDDFDASQTYPVIIMCHGMDATHAIYERGKWPMKMAQAGYISYVFDFCGGADKSLSDMSTLELSGETMQSDILAILNRVKELPYCNKDKIFLMGQSRGGLMAAIAAGRYPDEYAGLILLYPGMGMIESFRRIFPDVNAIEGDTVTISGSEFGKVYVTDVYDWNVPEICNQYNGNVLLIHGMADKTVPYTESVDALANLYAESESELVLISGKQSVHAFDVFWAPGQKIAWKAALDYMETEVAREAE